MTDDTCSTGLRLLLWDLPGAHSSFSPPDDGRHRAVVAEQCHAVHHAPGRPRALLTTDAGLKEALEHLVGWQAARARGTAVRLTCPLAALPALHSRPSPRPSRPPAPGGWPRPRGGCAGSRRPGLRGACAHDEGGSRPRGEGRGRRRRGRGGSRPQRHMTRGPPISAGSAAVDPAARSSAESRAGAAQPVAARAASHGLACGRRWSVPRPQASRTQGGHRSPRQPSTASGAPRPCAHPCTAGPAGVWRRSGRPAPPSAACGTAWSPGAARARPRTPPPHRRSACACGPHAPPRGRARARGCGCGCSWCGGGRRRCGCAAHALQRPRMAGCPPRVCRRALGLSRGRGLGPRRRAPGRAGAWRAAQCGPRPPRALRTCRTARRTAVGARSVRRAAWVLGREPRCRQPLCAPRSLCCGPTFPAPAYIPGSSAARLTRTRSPECRCPAGLASR
jgi:hypothetical protein